MNEVLSFLLLAESGIRVLTVTGVQTCALPICRSRARLVGEDERDGPANVTDVDRPEVVEVGLDDERVHPRTEERRVGKEGRPRWEAHVPQSTSNGTKHYHSN